MNKNNEIPRNIQEVVNIINCIGEAGINEIENFTIKDSNNKSVILFSTSKGNGENYHFYNHNVSVIFSNDEKLIVETKALENPTDCRYCFATQILVTYDIKGEKYRIISYLPGWNYDNLLSLSDRKYVQISKHVTDENDDIKGPFAFKGYNRIDINNNECEQAISDILYYNLDYIIEQKNNIENKIDNILENLSDAEIKVLKKKLK